VSAQWSFDVPTVASVLSLSYTVSFDTTAFGFIKDAVEATVVDGQGNPLVQTFTGSRDACLNITEGQSPALGTGTTLNSTTPNGTMLNVDLSAVTPGSRATLVLRLVNNDRDVSTSVRIVSGPVNVAPVVQTAGNLTGNEG